LDEQLLAELAEDALNNPVRRRQTGASSSRITSIHTSIARKTSSASGSAACCSSPA
jgi:hypothetical protein